MLDRRELIARCAALLVSGTWARTAMATTTQPASAADAAPRLVFIHGRAQQGKDPAVLKAQWLTTLRKGALSLNRPLPAALDVAFPFYGDKLDEFARAYEIPLSADVRARGSAADVDEDFLAFQAELAEALRTRAGITNAQVDAFYGPNPTPRGPENWAWVQAILQALDSHVGGMTRETLEAFMRDVYLYTYHRGVSNAIDAIVAPALDERPAVVVAHSLGTVIAFNILRSERRALHIPLLITLGSPLAIRGIRNQFRPLSHPGVVTAWRNAYDPRDVVALYPLDEQNFPVRPSVVNHAAVDNHTENRHGIVGYLDDPWVAAAILDALG